MTVCRAAPLLRAVKYRPHLQSTALLESVLRCGPPEPLTHRTHFNSITLIHLRKAPRGNVRLAADCAERLVVRLKRIHMLSVRGTQGLVKILSSCEITEHP